MSFLSESYQIVIYRAVDTPVHVIYVMDGFNAVQKLYLATCLRMCNTREVDMIDSKHMLADIMTDKGEERLPKNIGIYCIFVMKLVPMVIRNMQNVNLKHA